jgi:hypothetical protein
MRHKLRHLFSGRELAKSLTAGSLMLGVSEQDILPSEYASWKAIVGYPGTRRRKGLGTSD